MSGNRPNNFSFSNKILLLGLFCFWQAMGLVAQTATPSPSTTPTPFNSVKEKWLLGFTVLKDKQLAQENKYLCYSLPLLLKQSLQTISSHKLSEEELALYRKKQLNYELVTLQKKLDNLKLTRDKKFFDKSIASPAELEKNTDVEAREQLVKQINETAQKDLATIQVQEKVRLEIKINHEKDQLFPLPFFSLLELAKTNNIDLYIWGEIEEIQDYLYLHISLFNTLQEKNIIDFDYATAPDKIYDVVPKIIDKLAAYILGRPWAALTVKPEPDVSTVEVNGEIKGLGEVAQLFVEPGEYKVKVMHTGYKTYEETVTLAAGEKKNLNIKLEEANFKTFTVETDPPEAAIYLNSLWQGKSPLELQLAELPQSLIIKKEGYRELRTQLEESSPAQLHYALRKDVYDLSKRQQRKRDAFYAALGFFAISVPLPFICYYYYQDIALQTLADGTRDALNQRVGFYYAYAGGVFLTLSLGVNMLVNLSEYIKATNNLQEN